MKEVEAFLYQEGRLADEGRYAEWLTLWASECVYRVPCNPSDDPSRKVSIIFDDRTRLEERIARLESGSVLAQEPRPRMRRLISNVQVEHGGDCINVRSNFLLGLVRNGRQDFWMGDVEHQLIGTLTSLQIKEKHVHLINANIPMSSIQFII